MSMCFWRKTSRMWWFSYIKCKRHKPINNHIQLTFLYLTCLSNWSKLSLLQKTNYNWHLLSFRCISSYLCCFCWLVIIHSCRFRRRAGFQFRYILLAPFFFDLFNNSSFSQWYLRKKMSTRTDWDWGIRIGTNPNPILRIKLEFISGILLFSPVLRTALYSESILLPVTVWMIISLSTLSFYCLSSAPFPLAYTCVQMSHIWKCLWCSHCLSITELFSTSIHSKEFPTVPSTSPWLTFTKHNQPAFLLHHWETTLVKMTKFSSTLRQRTKEIVFNCEEKRNHKVKGQSSACLP